MKIKLFSLLLFLGCIFYFGQKTKAFPKTTPSSIKIPPVISSPAPSEHPVYKLMELAYLWELLQLNYQYQGEQDVTWLEVGFRAKYGMARKYASLNVVEAAFGIPVFLKGPHQGDMNYKSTTSFGHYNPAFISQLKTTFQMALQHPNYKTVLQQVYQHYIRGMALTYKDAYYYIHSNPSKLKDLKKGYLAALNTPQGTTEGSLKEVFSSYATGEYFSKEVHRLAEKENFLEADWYEQVTAPAFWLRRSIDGTSEQLFDLLDLVIKELEE